MLAASPQLGCSWEPGGRRGGAEVAGEVLRGDCVARAVGKAWARLRLYFNPCTAQNGKGERGRQDSVAKSMRGKDSGGHNLGCTFCRFW